MSDGDRIQGIPRRWSSLYRKMSEGYVSDLSLADSVTMSLKKDIQGYGNPAIYLLKEATIHLDSVLNDLSSSVSWIAESNFVSDLGKEYNYRYPEHKYGIEMVLRACNAYLHKFRNGQSVIGSLDLMMAEQYVREIYNKNFVGKVDTTPDADRYIVREKIDDIQKLVENGIVSLATQIVEKEDVEKLKVRRQAPKEHITHESLLLEVQDAVA